MTSDGFEVWGWGNDMDFMRGENVGGEDRELLKPPRHPGKVVVEVGYLFLLQSCLAF